MEYIEKVISSTEPLKIDDQSSPTTVYLRENIKRRSVLDPITNKYTAEYSYSEKRYTREEWLNEVYKNLTEDTTKPKWQLLYLEGNNMAKMYYNMIKKGIYTIEQVPVLYREQVRKMLNDNK